MCLLPRSVNKLSVTNPKYGFYFKKHIKHEVQVAQCAVNHAPIEYIAI